LEKGETQWLKSKTINLNLVGRKKKKVIKTIISKRECWDDEIHQKERKREGGEWV